MPNTYKVLGQVATLSDSIDITNKSASANVVTLTTDGNHQVVVGQYATVSEPAIVGTVTNKALTSNVATLTLSAAHRIKVGQSIVVADVDATFNGTYTVTAVTETTFSYEKTASNVSSTSASGTATYYDQAFNGTFLVDANDSTTTFSYTYNTADLASTSASGTMQYVPWVTAYTCPSNTAAVTSTIAICNQSGYPAKYQLAVSSDLDPDRKDIIVWNDSLNVDEQIFYTTGVTLDSTAKYLLLGCDTEGVSINVFGMEIS